MKYTLKKDCIYFTFYDDFDYTKIQSIKHQVIEIINRNKQNKIYFDFKHISFIDSTGIGFVLARYRDLLKMKKTLIVCNLSKENKIIFEMSGVFSLVFYEENGV